ncbi:acyltransferase family protein [Candidatus Pantoea floridensis]|uniref:Peptidoglycan/LPS O-acetylase OafA/YrhL, contains acyltransferase and SGNH-hydrolase domains n=1 Tax=Candidatus Pantoea floridensis TaxID=1938870 RepID=A0A286DS08_9GAMM|nr:acyltransferase [Pantoea floridensis]PIF06901.1 peptidoglycan/LPS O-acetylase OafA/YrhL [Enterobacteriaceae bacterium JKS000233]SOD61403.1 Peptidoglycan/LPS O-acetylase OafA/YrhL, contains acyltransferase and SGNH-hydrolase domains [Pantoea floridensis]
MHKMVNKNTSYRGVQALRGLAALSVMLFHFRWNLNEVTPDLGNRLFGWGATGVDLFFMISGFVITLSIRRSPSGMFAALQFMKNRALRILPAYYIILLITFLLGGAMSTFHYEDKTANLISAIIFQPIYPDHPPFYVDDDGMYGVRWTLNYEMYFYFAMSCMLLFNRKWLATSMFFLSSLIIVPLYVFGKWTTDPAGYQTTSALLGLITNPIILLFLAGMVIGLILPTLNKIPASFSAALLTISLLMAAYFFSQGMYLAHGLISSGWLYVLILMFTVLSEPFIGKYVPTVLIKLGDVSFSLYLIHTMMNGGVGKRFEDFGIEPGWLRFVLSVVISLGLAWVSWRFIEKRFTSKKMAQPQTHKIAPNN